ncbi:longiborneol synthase [Fusarium austroafricanum]|uniref:Longiborneol synthase n=1 Tax=Fusarium austroafricanum TaxID=2364996 RepID=A0A8H4KFR6_9HYPO|nr:longiborneol synthase [Fusarium austroafricanum]
MGPTLSTLHYQLLSPLPVKPSPDDPIQKYQSKPEDLQSFIQPLITSFANEIGYAPLSKTSNDALWKAMRAYADKTGVPYEEGSHSWLMFKVGYMYPVVCFPHHPFEVQLYVGIYSWLGLLLDDEAGTYLDEFQMFHERFCADEKQPIPLLQGWADLMKLTFKYWDPIVANFIVSSSLNFLNSNALEARKEFTGIQRTKAGGSWAWFMRDKDGVGEAYAWFTFPKTMCPDISCFMEMIPDLSAWIGLTNDILSFYKEEKAGETHNYIHTKGWYEDKDAQTVFEDIVADVTTKTEQMRLVLKGREPYLKLLNSHVLGYIAFHKLNSRYRLWEVGLGEDATDRTLEDA